MAWIDLDKLLRDISIVDVAQRLGIETRIAGDRTLALCPFHSDTKPSAVLYPEAFGHRPHFHCYACGEHGDIISLVKQVNQTDFKTSVQWLASAFGKNVQTEERTSKIRQPTEDRAEAMTTAFDIYRKKNRTIELNRWAKSRRIDKKTLAAAGITFAQANTLSEAVAAMPFNEGREIGGELEDAALIRRLRSEAAGHAKSIHLPLETHYTDFFSNDRVIIPLQNVFGKIVGLVARAANESSETKTSKYLVAKGTAKGSVLFLAHKTFPALVEDAKATKKDQYLVSVQPRHLELRQTLTDHRVHDERDADDLRRGAGQTQALAAGRRLGGIHVAPQGRVVYRVRQLGPSGVKPQGATCGATIPQSGC